MLEGDLGGRFWPGCSVTWSPRIARSGAEADDVEAIVDVEARGKSAMDEEGWPKLESDMIMMLLSGTLLLGHAVGRGGEEKPLR